MENIMVIVLPHVGVQLNRSKIIHFQEITINKLIMGIKMSTCNSIECIRNNFPSKYDQETGEKTFVADYR